MRHGLFCALSLARIEAAEPLRDHLFFIAPEVAERQLTAQVLVGGRSLPPISGGLTAGDVT